MALWVLPFFLCGMNQYNPRESSSESRIQVVERAVAHRQFDLTIVLENVHDEHNVAAVLRSCDAVGIDEVHLVYHSGQTLPVFGKKTSGGARKWVRQHKHDSVEDCFRHLHSQGYTIYATKLDERAVSLYDVDFTKKVALVFGNEHSGVSDTAAKLADGMMIIPQVGMVQSLNISVACAVSVFEASRQRRVAGMYDSPQLDAEGYEIMVREWLQR
jgi:tRNA (guanosine-2'-O-)-methyltransferase